MLAHVHLEIVTATKGHLATFEAALEAVRNVRSWIWAIGGHLGRHQRCALLGWQMWGTGSGGVFPRLLIVTRLDLPGCLARDADLKLVGGG